MPETCLAEAMALMRFYQVDALPVTVGRQLVGFLQLRDVLALFFPGRTLNQVSRSNFDARRLQDRYAPLMRAAVKKLIVTGNRSVAAGAPVSEAVGMMLNEHVTRLAVIEHDKVVGMISFDDVKKAILGVTSTRAAA